MLIPQSFPLQKLFCGERGGRTFTGFPRPCELTDELSARCGRTINRLRPKRMGTYVLLSCKSPQSDMRKTRLSTDGNPSPGMLHSAHVTPVAQLAETAPIAPPQNLEAEESVLGAMLLSPGAMAAVAARYSTRRASTVRATRGSVARRSRCTRRAKAGSTRSRSSTARGRGGLEEAGRRPRSPAAASGAGPATADAGQLRPHRREMATLRGSFRR